MLASRLPRWEDHNSPVLRPACHSGGNPGTHRVVRRTERIGREMRVSGGCGRVLVAEQGADDRQAQPARGADRGEAMPQIVQPDIVERSRLA
jgi:hypothetical protein